jgi:O-antigen ligase
MAVFKYFFFVFLFLLPLQTVYLLREVFVGGEKWQYGSILVYASDFALLFSIIALVFSSWREWMLQITNYKLQITSLILLVLWAGLSILWAPDQALAGYFFVKLLLAAGVFFLARSLDDDDVKIALRVLMVGAVLQSLLGTWQFLSQSTFASTLLGMSAHEVWQAGTSVLKNDTGRWLRAYGTFSHPNMLGGFLADVFVLCVSYYVLRIEELKKNQRVAFLVGIVSIFLGLLLTFSRSAWLGAVLGIFTYIVFRIKYHVWGKWDTRIFLTLAIAAVVFAGVLHETVFSRFDGTVIENEGSVSERVQSLEDAKVAIGEGNMLLGTGVGNFTAQMMALQPERPVWTIQPAHNVFILVFAELGLIGLVLFSGFIVFLLVPILKSLSVRQAGKIVNQKSAILVTLLPILLLDHYLWTSHFGLFFLFLFLGLASRK